MSLFSAERPALGDIVVTPAAANVVGVTVQGLDGQTSDAFQYKNSAGVVVWSVPVSATAVLVGESFDVTFGMAANASLADQAFYVAPSAVRVVAVSEVHSTAGSDGSAVNLQVTKDVSTDAPGGGTDLLTNNANAGFNLKGTANTTQVGTLTATVASLKLAAGDRLSVDFAGTLTAVAGVVVTVTLKRI
jgi:hypothetical protein